MILWGFDPVFRQITSGWPPHELGSQQGEVAIGCMVNHRYPAKKRIIVMERHIPDAPFLTTSSLLTVNQLDPSTKHEFCQLQYKIWKK